MKNTHIPESALFLIAGPCLIESKDQMQQVAEVVATIQQQHKLTVYLKGSFKKANRSSIDSFTTIGTEKALTIIRDVGAEFGLPTLTDIHEVADADMASY